VLFETWYDGLANTQGSPEQRRYWSELLAIRDTASRVLEEMRKNEKLGAALEAELTIHADPELIQRYAAMADELRFFFITSDVKLHAASKVEPLVGQDGESAQVNAADVDGKTAWVRAAVTLAPKCIRCWHRRDDVGSHPEHPEICGRCVGNVEGPGEDRRWF